MSLEDDVYGRTYKSAETQMSLIKQSISNQNNIGFSSIEELETWAHNNCLDKVAYGQMQKRFMFVSHKGELLTKESFLDYYSTVLFVMTRTEDRVKRVPWLPEGFKYFDKAYMVGEQSDGIHKPLYSRNYVVPTGYYDQLTDTFNIAKPFPVFAKATGKDTSLIYRYIEHVAGECAMHLLAWLRAKLLYPTIKTQVVPIIVSKTQGSGKSTFGEVICKGLFGKENVLVTDQYDSQARFNSDYADALIVCQEEKEEVDKRNPAASLKSRATATTIRKEQKGVDPIYQESYTDFVMTTNKDVPIKFDGREDQRRFMVMESDPTFTRKQSSLADEVFSKLYGFDGNYNKVGVPFVDDYDLIAQFKHELFTRKDIAEVNLRDFPKTNAYRKCFTLPRTTEAVEIESILKALVPFIKASLDQDKLVTLLEDNNSLSDVIQTEGAMQFIPKFRDRCKLIVICRPLVFYDTATSRPYPHSTVERAIYDCSDWLAKEYGIAVIADMEPLPGGFANVRGRYRTAPAARFALVSDLSERKSVQVTNFENQMTTTIARIGSRQRFNDKWKPDPNGQFETVNEIKQGMSRCIQNVAYMDTFVLEADDVTTVVKNVEQLRAEEWITEHGEGSTIQAETLYKERLDAQLNEATRLFNEGIAARIVYSGSKSYHIIIRMMLACETFEQYKWLHGYLCQTLSDKLIFDESTSDPCRLTRAPVTCNRITTAYGLLVEGKQQLIREDWTHLYSLDWKGLYEQWCNRPLEKAESIKGKRLMPTKQEYREAMQAVLDGEFFTDSKWDGRRQRCFFPAYRLLRLLGFSHDELWPDIMCKNVDQYKNKNEIMYWKTRDRSRIVLEIDTQVDEYERAMSCI